MTEPHSDLKDEIVKSLDAMRTLRDEVRLKVHLAGMEVKDEWRKLEPHLFEVEQAAHQVTDATRNAVSEALKRLAKLRSSMS